MRCEKNPKDFIIFPLDLPSLAKAREYIEILADSVGMFKVGLELFITAGPEIIHAIHNSGTARIFLDLKLHDIPATVFRAMAAVAELGVAFATVHCGENRRMLRAAVEGAEGKVGVLGVTVLTSVSGSDLRMAGFQDRYHSDISRLVLKRATEAKQEGCAGIVCSGQEVEGIKRHFGKDFFTVTPGIRPSWENSGCDDQKRVSTPSEAVRGGADYLVIGRPIRDADDPKKAAHRIAAEISSVLQED